MAWFVRLFVFGAVAIAVFFSVLPSLRAALLHPDAELARALEADDARRVDVPGLADDGSGAPAGARLSRRAAGCPGEGGW